MSVLKQKNSRTLAALFIAALLLVMPFVKAAHKAEHEFFAEQNHCQICSVTATDNVIPPALTLGLVNIDHLNSPNKQSTDRHFSQAPYKPLARAPPKNL